MGMGKRWIKRVGVGIAGLVVVAGAALVIAAQLGERKMQRRIEVQVAAVAARTDAQSIERGRYLFQSRGCTDCHGTDGGGKVVVDDGNGLLIKGPDITSGPGGVVSTLTIAEIDAEEGLDLTVFEGAWSGLVDRDDIDEAGQVLADGRVAVLVVYENSWAAPLVGALRRSGAQVVAGGRITVDALLGALDATEIVA